MDFVNCSGGMDRCGDCEVCWAEDEYNDSLCQELDDAEEEMLNRMDRAEEAARHFQALLEQERVEYGF